MELLERAWVRSRDAQLALGVEVFPVSWAIGSHPHFRKPRGFGVTYEGPPCRVVLARKLKRESASRQEGIIRHELGHVIDFLYAEDEVNRWAFRRGLMLPGQDIAEMRADAIARALWGDTIYYDSDDVQSITEGVAPRPRRLGW